MAAETGWPYDADRDDPLTKLRIPVTSEYPRFTYTACFDRESEARPTDAEARMIASFIEEYQSYFFGESAWRKKQQAKAFDMDCYTTTIFHKWGDGDWSFRVSTWRYGPAWVPVFPGHRGGPYDYEPFPGPKTLLEVMDRAHANGPGDVPKRWLEWKSAHPDVFPAVGDA